MHRSRIPSARLRSLERVAEDTSHPGENRFFDSGGHSLLAVLLISPGARTIWSRIADR